MTDVDESPQRPRWVGWARALGFAILGVGWVIASILFTAVLLLGQMATSGSSLAELAALDPDEMFGAGGLVLSVLFQTGGLLGLAVLLAILIRARGDDRPIGAHLASVFAIRRPPVALTIVAFLGGLCVGLGPGWLVEQVKELAPALDLGNNAMIIKLIAESSVIGQVAMLFAVVVFAPLVEELLFRGYLWNALEHLMPPWAVWVATSLIFAAFHMDLISVIALVFTGLYIGWLRWVSGSIWPSIGAHFANNGLAALAAVTLDMQPDVATPWWLAGLAGAATMAFAGLAWRLGRTR